MKRIGLSFFDKESFEAGLKRDITILWNFSARSYHFLFQCIGLLHDETLHFLPDSSWFLSGGICYGKCFSQILFKDRCSLWNEWLYPS